MSKITKRQLNAIRAIAYSLGISSKLDELSVGKHGDFPEDLDKKGAEELIAELKALEGSPGLRTLWMLSVDPGASSAYMLWERDVLPSIGWVPMIAGRLDLSKGGEPRVLRCRRLLEGLSVCWRRAHVVVEGQFYVDHKTSSRRGYQASPWTDVEALIECRSAWQNAAILLGATASTAKPGVWIGAMTRGEQGLTSKDRIKAACGKRLPGVRLVADEHDAALLGAWWIEERGEKVLLADRG